MMISTRLLAAVSLALLASFTSARAQPYPPPPSPDTTLQAAGEELEAEAQSLHELAQDVVAGTRRGDALLRDLTALRTAINQFRTGIDVQADPQVLGRRFARVAERYRDVRRDLSLLPGDQKASLDERVRRLDRAFRETAELMG
jgi:hypothetical protein